MKLTRTGAAVLAVASIGSGALAGRMAARRIGALGGVAAFAVVGASVAGALLVWVASAYKRMGLGSATDDGDQIPAKREQRTRDGAKIKRRAECDCSLLLWEGNPKNGADSVAIDVFTGFSGLSHVSVDCCLYDEEGRHWMI